jgi:GNAT superfamily N-acetyltransferase
MTIKILTADQLNDASPPLADLLVEAAQDGASVQFLESAGTREAQAFWRDQLRHIADGRLVVLAAFDHGVLIGSLSLSLDPSPTRTHRATLHTMVVQRDHQRRGIGSALLAMAEVEARRRERWLITMETVSGNPAARLFERAGWERIGDMPAAIALPHGGLAPASLYFKRL